MFKTSNINFGKVCECDQALVKFYHFYGKEISSLERDYKLSLSRVNKILQSGFHNLFKILSLIKSRRSYQVYTKKNMRFRFTVIGCQAVMQLTFEKSKSKFIYLYLDSQIYKKDLYLYILLTFASLFPLKSFLGPLVWSPIY